MDSHDNRQIENHLTDSVSGVSALSEERQVAFNNDALVRRQLIPMESSLSSTSDHEHHNRQQSWDLVAFDSDLSRPGLPSSQRIQLCYESKSVGAVVDTLQSSALGVDGPPTGLGRRSVTTSAIGSNAKCGSLPAVSSVIHDAARITDWQKVLNLCENNPEWASYAGRDGWTALHHACNRRCPRPEVVEALIKAYPEALLQEDEKGWLPLHYACRFKAPKAVVRLLLHMYPESGRAAVAQVDRLGRTPLYYAVRYDAPPGVVGLLLQVDPSVVLEEDQNDESPLALVWDTWAEKIEGKRVIHSFLPGGFEEPDNFSAEERAQMLHKRLQRETKLRNRWNKVNMLLKAAFGFPVEDDEDADNEAQDVSDEPSDQRQWRIVHATAAVKCHISLFLLACALHPEQAREYDRNDLRRPGDPIWKGTDSSGAHQTALHLAASSNAGGETGKTVLITLLSLYQEAAEQQDGISGSLPLHRMVENTRKHDWPNHAGILYHFYPRAVQIQDHHGKLPLHRAAAAIKHFENDETGEERSVIIQLVRAYPQATFQADGAGCLPFHYIAFNAHVWDDDVESVHSVNRNDVQTRAGSDMFNRLPIHLAAANIKSRESLIQKLIQLHPRGASVPDSQGKLPLHLVCENGKEWDAGGVRSIYDAFPNAIRLPEENARGWLPLHMAAASPKSDVNLIKKLVELYPESACIADREGRFPLHIACGTGNTAKQKLPIVEVLFSANASALSSFDKFQQLPFHIAALFYSKGTHAKERKVTTKQIPLLEALKEKTIDHEDAADLDILYQLLRTDPSTITSL